MPDEKPIDPVLLRAMRGIFGGNTVTRGAGLVDNPSVMRTLQNNMPRVMPGFNAARPGVGFMPNNKPTDSVAQGEMLPDELSYMANSTGGLNRPIPGGNIDPQRELNMPGMAVNDPQNLLKMRLDRMRNKDDEYKYQMALAWQRYNQKKEPEQPVFTGPATVKPILPEITPRKPHGLKQIYGAATKLDALGNKEDAAAARQYNFKTEKFRDAIKDYQLAHTDLRAWTEKNAVPDLEKGMEDMERLNSNLVKTGHKPLNFMEFKELSRYELQNKMRKQGVDNFYSELKNNLTSMHSELDRIHKLIEDHSNGE